MILLKGLDQRLRRLNWSALLLGVCGLFGYHFFFFLALRHAPVLEATLVNYLWPLLIVLFSSLLPTAHSSRRGAALVASRWGDTGIYWRCSDLVCGCESWWNGAIASSNSWLGYLAALIAALIWSSYSVTVQALCRCSHPGRDHILLFDDDRCSDCAYCVRNHRVARDHWILASCGDAWPWSGRRGFLFLG